jgi:hypothetical protein
MALENDWIFLQVAEPGLRDYLLSRDLYRPMLLPPRAPRNTQIPQLTIGSLLLSQARLSTGTLDPAQEAEFAGLNQRIAQVRSEWRSHWSQKAAQEYASRLHLWDQYLRDLRADRRANATAYPTHVRQRAILHLLAPEILEGVSEVETARMNSLDGILRGSTQPGAFVWESEVERAFPRDGFWFLYVRIKI